MHRGNHQSDGDDTLYLSPESRELLRQVLRVESLDGESHLISAVKEALRLQYSRGFHEGVAEGTKGAALPVVPPPRTEHRSLSRSVHRGSLSSQERRRKRRQLRFRKRLRNALATVVMIVMAGAALLAINASRPELSATNPRARHRIDFAP